MMTCRIFSCSSVFVLLVLLKDHARAKPLPDLQSLSRLLEDNFEHSFGYEEPEHENVDLEPTDQQESDHQWSRTRLEPAGSSHLSEISLQQLLNDPLGSSRRYRLRSKKGISRGCFGVKLDRIGSLSGLGC
ncbi:C-type natriuretic peptide 1-like [Pelobates fuscus]|uniref:C-type natriuretic peptide 1-like n=1 Tax=Pelobates fuscus TaxID=191477 RepID=UPI002FE49C66